MPFFTIQTTTQHTLFSGTYPDFKSCVEDAVRTRTDLSCADFRYTDLSCANLDDGIFARADFTEANLSGANLSESILTGCIFRQSTLIDTCLAYADLSAASIHNARCGATDITGAIMMHTRLSGLSCFTLNFIQASTTEGCVFTFDNGTSIPMSPPPLVTMGLFPQPVIITEHVISIGQNPKILSVRCAA